MKGKDVACKKSPPLGFDRVFILTGTVCSVLAWFVWHFIFDLVLQVILGMSVMVLWLKNLQLKRHLTKLENTRNRA